MVIEIPDDHIIFLTGAAPGTPPREAIKDWINSDERYTIPREAQLGILVLRRYLYQQNE